MKYSVIQFFIIVILTATSLQNTQACTGWGFADQKNVWLVKNRDFTPSPQFVELQGDSDGYRYVALVTSNKKQKTLPKAGINEKGVSVINLSAATVLNGSNNCPSRGPNTTQNLLAHYSSVQEIINASEQVFQDSSPAFYIIADKKEVAYIEIAPKKSPECKKPSYSIQTMREGFLTHTNHYLSPSLTHFNSVSYQSSKIRLDRIGELLAKSTSNPTFAEFLNFAHETLGGPNNSLFRFNHETPESKRTMATWIVKIPKDGSAPSLNVSLYPSIRVDSKSGRLLGVDSVNQTITLSADQFESTSHNQIE